jgi:Tfp pilus assembly protein FimT
MTINRETRLASQRGITLPEVLMVVAISMVMAALTSHSMQSAVNVYQVTRSCRQLAALAQMAKIHAAGRATRYRLRIDATNRRYLVEYCSSSSGADCTAWTADPYTGQTQLPTGVSFTAAGIGVAPPEQSSVTLASEMTFNSMGLLYDESGHQLADGRCFYLQASSGERPMAVCATMAGKTTVYQLYSGTWEVQ